MSNGDVPSPTGMKDRIHVLRLLVGARTRALTQRLNELPSRRLRYAGMTPERIIVAIPDFRPADAVFAEQIYSGIFSFAGRVMHVGAEDVFALSPPSPRFRAELAGFAWLRHVAADGTPLANANARRLTQQWLRLNGERLNHRDWTLSIAARRLLAWLQHGAVPLQGADASFHQAFMRSIGLHERVIRGRLASVQDGADRLRCQIALTAARLALPGPSASFHRRINRLAAELAQQVKPDGGHVSRSPEVMMDLLFDLVALSEGARREGVSIPEDMIAAMDRMNAALSFFRHADGELALFNGTGAMVADELSALFRHDEARAAAPESLPHSGFERMARQGAVVIADVGGWPPAKDARRSHAGTLSFEMSSSRQRFIVNAGVDTIGPEAYRQISRQTVAHSTLAIDDRSSARFIGTAKVIAALGHPVARPPRQVTRSRITGDDGAIGFEAAHDGYLDPFGVIHQRRVTLNDKGTRIDGEDRLEGPGGKAAAEAFRGKTATIRFHLHPAIHVILNSDGNMCLLAEGGDSWVLECPGFSPVLGDSFFFAKLGGAVKTKVIVISFDPKETPVVRWSLLRSGNTGSI